ncbi:hypothetical protein CC117_07220 [Parafrankia colletiae]|uniref:SnoaL-like domain-containing protein n=1 Tax=Parafrankia colletiae TaxID=573497 RepID=A0A1S1Q776_9ACTN|nr:hypothetical protein CC117_07220 [Parafrankia colletiae]
MGLERAAELVELLLSAWTDGKPARRQQTLDACCVPDVSYINPLSAVEGTPSVSELLGAIQAQYPGLTPVRVTELDLHHGYARFGWELRNGAGTVALVGTDIVEWTADGSLIESIITFFGPLQPRVATYSYP